MLRVMLKRLRRRRLGMVDALPSIGNVFLQRIERCFNKFLLASFVFRFVESSPILVTGVGTRHDEKAPPTRRARPGIIERKRAACHVATEQKIGTKQMRSRRKQQIAG